MRVIRLTIALTAINLVVLLLAAAQAGSTSDQTVVPVLRGRAIELVDDRGLVRAQLKVESSGEVMLKMTDRQGTIRVKLGAGEHGSGLMLADETTEPGVHLIARRTGTARRPTTTSIRLVGSGGEQRITPTDSPR